MPKVWVLFIILLNKLIFWRFWNTDYEYVRFNKIKMIYQKKEEIINISKFKNYFQSCMFIKKFVLLLSLAFSFTLVFYIIFVTSFHIHINWTLKKRLNFIMYVSKFNKFFTLKIYFSCTKKCACKLEIWPYTVLSFVLSVYIV